VLQRGPDPVRGVGRGAVAQHHRHREAGAVDADLVLPQAGDRRHRRAQLVGRHGDGAAEAAGQVHDVVAAALTAASRRNGMPVGFGPSASVAMSLIS
jgi:hypothetical protein